MESVRIESLLSIGVLSYSFKRLNSFEDKSIISKFDRFRSVGVLIFDPQLETNRNNVKQVKYIFISYYGIVNLNYLIAKAKYYGNLG